MLEGWMVGRFLETGRRSSERMTGVPGTLRTLAMPTPAEHRLPATFASICAAKGLRARLVGGPLAWEARFEDQGGADSATIARVFRDELRAAGLEEGEVRLPAEGDEAARARVEDALAIALHRTRKLLIEFGSWISGGLPLPFAGVPRGLRESGLACFRYPSRAATEVLVDERGVVIRFAPGDLGNVTSSVWKVTSSGWYVPALLEGDYTAQLDYELLRWRPSERDACCFAMTAVDLGMAHRHHAQRMSTGEAQHSVLSEHADVISPMLPVTGTHGTLEVARRGDRIACRHRGPDGWLELGEGPAPPEREMVLGAKVWGKHACDGLEVVTRDLRVEGLLTVRALPPVPVRPDPRTLEDQAAG